MSEGYLQSNDGFQESGILLSASDDGTSLIWDLRINKRVMFIQDKVTTQGKEITKAKFLDNGNYVMTAFGASLATFDVRKPAILITKADHHFDNPSQT